MNKIFCGDSLEVLKTLESDSVDLLCTDPPYGYSFMGKDWDKAVPSVEIWKECLRVLKPGGFAFIMSAPRSDVLSRMIVRIEDAGFRVDFTPLYWTYASGFPKAMNIGKMVDKRAGAYREVVGLKKNKGRVKSKGWGMSDTQGDPITQATSPEAKALDGSYGGFQPKPAVEVVIVAMKPLSEKTFVDQALKSISDHCGCYPRPEDGSGIVCSKHQGMGAKGVTWLDDCRIPTDWAERPESWKRSGHGKKGEAEGIFGVTGVGIDTSRGRFPANLLVSDDVLNDGRITRGSSTTKVGKVYGEERGTSYLQKKAHGTNIDDSGSYSRYFSLDAWSKTLPFLIVAKASKREKNEGLAGTLTVKYNTGICEENTAVVQLLQKVISDMGAMSFSIDESGESITAQCPSDSLSITLTTIRKTIALKILNSLMLSLTSDSTQGVNSETESGGSHAKSVASLRKWLLAITNDQMESARGVSNAVFQMLLKISDEGNWSESKNIHSTVKPLTLMSYLITLGSRAGDVVLDPFLGSGTTALAAKQLGRQFIGIEREAEYVAIAEARLVTVQNALL